MLRPDQSTVDDGDPGGGAEHRHATRPGDAPWLSLAVENSSEVVELLDADGTLRYVNPAFERVFGLSGRSVVGTPISGYVHPDDRARVRSWLRSLVSAGGPGRGAVEYRFRHGDGSWRHVEVVGSRLAGGPSGEGRVVVNVPSVAGARAVEERFRTLVERLPAVTFVDRAGTAGEPLYVSPQIEAMLGYTPEEWMEGRLWRERLHPEDRERVLAADRRLEGEGEPIDEEFRLLARDGSVVWVREETVPVRGDGGEPLFLQGLLTRITERKEAEERVRLSEAKLAESQRIAHLGTWEWNVRDGEVWWSTETFRLYGLEPGAVVPTIERLLELTHREDRSLLRTAMKGAIEGGEPYDLEHRIVRPDGAMIWVHRQAEVVRGEGGEVVRMIGTVHDVTERKEMEERLAYQAYHDPLTGLPNYALFMDRLRHALERTRRREVKASVLFMDLDDFKVVNDSLGHGAGDRLLVATAERLRSCLRPEDTLARFGGDEFVVLLEDVEREDEAVRVAERVHVAFRDAFHTENRDLYVGTSVGIALGDARNRSPEELLRDADTAMYEAKRRGGGYRIFDPGMYERAVRRLEMENAVREAAATEQFVVRYQPTVDLASGEIVGMEALVRWEHPERGLLDPSTFVPIAERSGTVVPMGRRVLEEACRCAVAWRRDHGRPLGVCVNLSAGQLRRPDLAETVARILERTGLAPRDLALDITEAVYVEVMGEDEAILGRLGEMGVRLCIDDFGMGHSSIAYLKRLPADMLKIDRSFVGGLGRDTADAAIVRMVVELAHTLGMQALAEGVETGEQLNLLKEMGCDLAQGFLFSPPLPPQEVAEALSNGSLGTRRPR